MPEMGNPSDEEKGMPAGIGLFGNESIYYSCRLLQIDHYPATTLTCSRKYSLIAGARYP
jgi:hypothetical protein